MLAFSSRISQLGRKTLGFVVVFAACAGTAAAREPVPEIDPSSIGGAIALLVAGMLLLMPRKRSVAK
jgi:hypothetical protein